MKAKKKCPWCSAPIRNATSAEKSRLRKLGTPSGYRMTLAAYERCTECAWTHTKATLEARP